MGEGYNFRTLLDGPALFESRTFRHQIWLLVQPLSIYLSRKRKTEDTYGIIKWKAMIMEQISRQSSFSLPCQWRYFWFLRYARWVHFQWLKCTICRSSQLPLAFHVLWRWWGWMWRRNRVRRCRRHGMLSDTVCERFQCLLAVVSLFAEKEVCCNIWICHLSRFILCISLLQSV